MTRVCTVCAHPQRQDIDKALVGRTAYRDIAGRYGVARSAIQRHAGEHLLAEIVAAWQRERHANGQEFADDLRAWMDTLTKLLQACDAWLTDPDDPARYTLGPRSEEVMIVYEAPLAGPVRPGLVDGVVAAARALVGTGGAERLAPGEAVIAAARWWRRRARPSGSRSSPPSGIWIGTTDSARRAMAKMSPSALRGN